VHALAQKTPALDAALTRAAQSGALPDVDGAGLDACNAQLSAYTSTIARRVRIDAARKAARRKESNASVDDRNPAAVAHGTDVEDSGITKVAEMVLESVKTDRHREPWFDGAIAQVI